MYLFLRYIPILVEAYVCFLSAPFVAHSSCRSLASISHVSPPLDICTKWHIYQASSLVAITLAVETVLVVRSMSPQLRFCELRVTDIRHIIVYALYNRNAFVIVPVLALWFLEATAMIISMCFAVPRMTFFGSCMVAYAPPCLMGYWYVYVAPEAPALSLTADDCAGCQRWHLSQSYFYSPRSSFSNLHRCTEDKERFYTSSCGTGRGRIVSLLVRLPKADSDDGFD